MNALPTPPLPPKYEVLRRRPRPVWKRVLRWVAAGLGILVLLIVIAVLVVLRSTRAHQYILSKVEQQVTTALGTQLRVRDFALHFAGISPTLDLYNVVVSGAAPYPNPPLLQVDHIQVAVRITSLLRRTWYLNNVQLDHPVVQVFVDRHGTDNLPQTKKSSSQSHTSVFDLGVRHAVLDRGEVFYNNRKSALEADLHDLTFQSAFDASQPRYSGTMSYRDGHLRMGTYNPVPHDLQARFNVTPTTFTLDRALLTSGPSQFVLIATLTDFAHPQLHATYSALLDTGEFRHILKNPSLPVGVVRLAGTMQYQSKPDVPMLESVFLDGTVNSSALQVRMPSFRGVIRDIGAHYTVAKNNAEVRDIRARLLGGLLTGTLTMRNITGASRSRLQAAVRDVSLAEAKTVMNSPSLRQVALGGTVNADADATWGKTMNNLVARTDATIRASFAPANAPRNSVPLNGDIHARYAAATKEIALAPSYLRTPETSLTLNGTVSNRSNLQLRLQANNLHEIETVANMFRTPTPGQPMQQFGLYGTALFTGAATGSTAAPHLTGQLAASDLKVKGSSWRVLRTNLNVSPSVASLQNGQLQPATRGNIAFNVTVGLRHWSFTPTSPLQVALNASQLNVADLAKAAGSQAPVSGTLSANLAVRGSERNPIGHGTVSLTQAKVSSETIQSLNLNFQGTGQAVHANLALRMPAGAAQGVFAYFPQQQGYSAQLQALGIRLDQLQTVKSRNLQVAGVLNLRASGQGTFNNPQLNASLQIPRLQVQNQIVSDLSLQTAVANHVANVALDSRAINTSIRGRATVNLTGAYDTDATLDTQPIPLQPLLAVYSPAQAPDINGQTELHATLRGPLKNKSAINAHVIIPTLRVNYKNTVQIGAASPIRIDYANNVLDLQRAVIRGTDTDLQFQAHVPLNSAAPASLLALGTVNLQIAQLFSPDITSSGELRFNINSYGARANPDVHGQIQIVNASLATGETPIGLQNGNGVLTLTKDRLDITRFQGTVGGGQLTASGGVVYKPALRFDLAVAGKGIRMLYPDTVREGVDLKIALAGTKDASLLSGQVQLTELSFTPDFDLQDFIGQLSGGATAPPSQGFSQNLQLNLGVQSTTGINLVSRELSLQGNANLHVQGTAAQPVVLGRVNISGGDLIFRGTRYVLQESTIDFVNPAETQPVVNLAVNTTIQQYDIRLQFYGPADHLHTNYASDPALPPADIINLLAFGKTTEASAANPTPANMQAQSLVASQVTGQVTSRVAKVAGLSQLSVDPTLGGNTTGSGQNPLARVTIQKRVTGNLFMTFSTDVTSTQNEVIQLQYRASPRVSFSGTRDENGGFGFDTRIHKTW